MSGAVLVDTSVWIDHLRGRKNAATEQLAHWLVDDPDQVLVNEVVTTELLRGVADEGAALELLNALEKLTQAARIERADWLQSAHIYRTCRRAGLTVRSPMDCLIAAQAIRLRVPVLAIDRDFDAIESCTPLTLSQPGAH